MRLCTLGIAATVITAGLFQSSEAVVRPKDADAPYVSAGRAPRSFRATAFERSRLAAAGLPGWTAIWDRDTDVPLRLWGPGRLASGSVADPAAAEAAARQFLAAYLPLLAPGAAASDFEVIGNALSRNGDVRSVGFAQRAGGVLVLGGTIGFAFKRDRLILVSSTALPHVAVTAPPPSAVAALRGTPALAGARAAAWLADDGFDAVPVASAAPAERVIIPIVRPRLGAKLDITYQLADQVELTSRAGPGQWLAWVDAGTGAPIARRSQLHYASGTVLYDVSDRHPNSTRGARPAGRATHTVNGVATTSTADGTVTWAGDAAATVTTAVVGPVVRVTNSAGARVAVNLTLPAGGTQTVNRATVEFDDAQLTSFVHTDLIKRFAKTRLNPNLAWLDQQISVTVNVNNTCNAFSNGDAITFFRAGGQCQNTGRMADVVYHEFGHSLHNQSIIPGVGNFDGALSEGVSDVLATLITNDSGMGRGFFFTSAPLREINPPNREKRWPEDRTGQVHDDGEIIGQTLWDLRTQLEAKLGPEAGYEKVLDIYYAILQRATDIPSTYAEALAADDDDGDLANGTPNQCAIDAAFSLHGLADAAIVAGIGAPVRDNFDISLPVAGGASGACPGGPQVASARLYWNVRGNSPPLQRVDLALSGGSYTGTIPAQPEGSVVVYQVLITLDDGTEVRYPNNPADPQYEFYVGPVKVIKCFDFESGLDGWTTGASPSNRDEWQVGAPAGLGGDPRAAHGGAGVLGIDLTTDGLYRPSVQTFAASPEIDVSRHPRARLQYYRWLGVEDGFYDDARLLVNGLPVWSNMASPQDPGAGGTNHIDREWRFVDHDLSAAAASGAISLRFELASDEGLELAGWTLDDVCLVEPTGAALTCGNGAIDAGETCDDGNRTSGDGCDANCVDETGGGGDDPGCCSTGASPTGPIALSLLALGLVLRRRRRS